VCCLGSANAENCDGCSPPGEILTRLKCAEFRDDVFWRGTSDIKDSDPASVGIVDSMPDPARPMFSCICSKSALSCADKHPSRLCVISLPFPAGPTNVASQEMGAENPVYAARDSGETP
jgi:hypothetical protein